METPDSITFDFLAGLHVADDADADESFDECEVETLMTVNPLDVGECADHEDADRVKDPDGDDAVCGDVVDDGEAANGSESVDEGDDAGGTDGSKDFCDCECIAICGSVSSCFQPSVLEKLESSLYRNHSISESLAD